jgi:HK97 family phage portal protein
MIAANQQHRILWLPGEERMWDEDAGSRSSAGVRISPDNALMVSTVFACIRVLAEAVATPALHVLERMGDGGKRRATELPLYRKLNLQPNGWQTSFEWRCQLMLHAGLYNVAYCEIVPGQSGAVDQLIPLHPSRMKVERLENGKLRYKYREERGQETVYNQEQILAIRGLTEDGINGLSPVETCKDAIALARAYELHGARYFAAGARPGFVLSTEGQLNAEARETLANQWDRKHAGVGNSHKTAVLTGGLKPHALPQNTNTDSQWLEGRRFQIEEICRLWRVPAWKIQAQGAMPPGSLETSSQEFLTDTIMPWLRRFESAFTRDLIVEDDRYEVSFDTRFMLRADSASRSTYYRQMWDLGVFNTNDIRTEEGMNPVDGGDVRYRPLNMGTLGQEPTATDVLAQQQPGSGIDGQAVEGGLAAAAEAGPVEQATPQVADVSLNGAQITGLIAILQQIPAGLISKDAAGALIAASFPSINASAVQAILAGVTENQAAAQPAPAPPAPLPPAARSLPESRALTISIDFDRTFAADPQLWGEFARKSAAEGNTVVMISRRPEEDRQTVTETLGEYADAFSQVLLVGGDTMKADAAQAAGIEVDVWVDDSPQFIRSAEQRAEPGTVAEGDFVSWDSSGGRARGRVDHVMDYGTLDVPGTDFTIDATEEDPAALITLYEEVAGGWRATETQVGHKVATLTKIDPLPEPPIEEKAYSKPKRKGRKRGG